MENSDLERWVNSVTQVVTSDPIKEIKKVVSDFLDQLSYTDQIAIHETSALKFFGLELERKELVKLKAEIDVWNRRLIALSRGEGWKFPKTHQDFNVASFTAHKWRSRLAGRSHNQLNRAKMIIQNEKLSRCSEHTRIPDVDFLKNCLTVMADLHSIWAVVAVRYAKAVAEKCSNPVDRMRLCEGLLN